MNTLHSGDYGVCVSSAKQFRRVSNILAQDDNFIVNGMYAYVVNAALSCELFLKAIAIYISPSSEFESGHDLKILFLNLPSHIQKELTETFEATSPHKLLDFLDQAKSSFVDWRYAMEKPVSICLSDFDNFLNILNDYVAAL